MIRPVGFLLLSALAAACSFDFQKSSEVVDRRVLAIQVEPPELANGAPLPSAIAVRALVVDPEAPEATAAYEWRDCPMSAAIAASSASDRCDETDPTTLLDSGTKPLDPLGLELPVPSAALALLAEPDRGEPAPSLRFQLKMASASGDLYAFKDLKLTRTLQGGLPPNQNPHLSGLMVDGVALAPGSTQSIVYDSCDATLRKQVASNGKQVAVCAHTLKPLFDEAESETYMKMALSGQYVQARERLRFAWFADHGSFSQGTSRQPDVETDPPDLGIQTEWREPVEKAAVTTIWVVVRDGRGGESWARWKIALE